MQDCMVRRPMDDREFGKDHGLVHEAIVTGRSVGAGKAFWARLAHNAALFRKVKDFVDSTGVLRNVEEIKIQIPALHRPMLGELQAHYWIRSIRRDISRTGAAIFSLATVLFSDEDFLDGREFRSRIMWQSNAVLGFQHAYWLMICHNEFPELRSLILQDIQILFPGLIVTDDNDEFCPILVKNCGILKLMWRPLSENFDAKKRIAVAVKKAV